MNNEERKARLARNTRAYRERHPDRVPLQRRIAYLNHRRKAFQFIGGAFCRNCGCDEIEFLELNHKNGGGSKDFRLVGNRIIDKIISGERDPKDYEVLCRVCNALDHLKRKNPDKAKCYSIDFTGKTAELINE